MQTLRINEISKIINGDRGKNYPSRKSFTKSGYPFINAGDIVDNHLSTENINFISEEKFNLLSNGKYTRGDIIFCLRGSLGKLALIDDDSSGAIASSLTILRCNEKVDSEYLYYFLQSDFTKKQIQAFENGTAQPNLSAKNLGQFQVPLPTLLEQKQIVSKIKECFILLDKSEQKLKQAEEKLSLVINSSNKLFKTKTSNITYKLSEVFKLRNGKFNPSSNLKNNFDTEFKFKVYGGNGVTGYFNKALVQGQTIIIGRVGAKCGSIHKSKEPVWVTDNALYIETFLKEVDLEFLYWKLISLNLNGLSDGTGQPKIDQSKIYNLTIDIPNTIEEQKRIARQFEITNERVNNSLAQIQSNKSAIQNIRQSILKKAFEGTLI